MDCVRAFLILFLLLCGHAQSSLVAQTPTAATSCWSEIFCLPMITIGVLSSVKDESHFPTLAATFLGVDRYELDGFLKKRESIARLYDERS
jgi:hypothetical protein